MVIRIFDHTFKYLNKKSRKRQDDYSDVFNTNKFVLSQLKVEFSVGR